MRNPRLYLIFTLIAVFCLVFISNESLWLDEGHTVVRAGFPGFQAWYHHLIGGGGSDSMMPGYMLIMWGWFKMTGLHEFALRSSNIIWFGISVLAMTRFRFGWIGLLLSPFALYYLSELRPYAMQIAGGSLLIASYADDFSSRKSGWLFLAGAFILCSSSLTGIVWATAGGLFLLIDRPSAVFNRRFLIDCAFASPMFVILGIYYLNPELLDKGPDPWGGNLIVSFGAAAYELSGMMGLGPSRNALRENANSLFDFIVPISIGALVFGISIGCGLWAWLRESNLRKIVAAAVAIGVPLGFFVYLCIARDFRFLGRHLAPLAPLVSLLISRNLAIVGKRRIIAVAALALGLFSALNLRFSPRHRKDDYKHTTAIALSLMKEGHKVVWAADKYVAGVYHTPGAFEGTPNWTSWQFREPGTTLAGDEIVFLSKPDISDRTGELGRQLAERGYTVTRTYPAFKILEAPKSSSSPNP